jgi:hypothetical protein
MRLRSAFVTKRSNYLRPGQSGWIEAPCSFLERREPMLGFGFHQASRMEVAQSYTFKQVKDYLRKRAYLHRQLKSSLVHLDIHRG